MTSSSSRFGNATSAPSTIAKQMSQSALKLKAVSQLRHVLRSSPNRGALAFTLGKDLMLVLRYIPLGIMNKFQQFAATQNDSNQSSSSPPPTSSPSAAPPTPSHPKSTPPLPSPKASQAQAPVAEKKVTVQSVNASDITIKSLPEVKPNTQVELYTPPAVILPQMDQNSYRLIEENLHWQNIEARAKYLTSVLQESASSSSSLNMMQHMDDLFSHIYQNPDAREVVIQKGALRTLVKILKTHDDMYIANRTRETLAILGYNPPTKGQGIRILSIDGGGIRGVVAIEVLRMIEKITGRRTYELFDYICGVSTGSILAFLLGAHRRTLDEAEAMYKVLSKEIFSQNSFIGNANLMWSHAYYHTPTFEKILKKHCGEIPLISLARDPDLPRVSAISTIVNQERVVPYVFRTYTLPPSVRPRYNGGCRYEMWEAVRASAAAPSYFEEFKLGANLHQDGGILVNNPTSVALSEAKTVWPGYPLQCVMSLGTGLTMSSRSDKTTSDLFNPADSKTGVSSLSWKGKFLKVLDSATDTESVHNTLNELIPPNIYFRFNPYLSEMVSMDETCSEKMEQVQRETREYLTRNIARVKYVSTILMKPKSVTKRLTDWWYY